MSTELREQWVSAERQRNMYANLIAEDVLAGRVPNPKLLKEYRRAVEAEQAASAAYLGDPQ